MDRVFFYPGELLQDTDLLNLQKNAMIGIGAALEMMLGQNTIACGFSCSALSNTAVSGSAFAVSISRGFLSSYQEVDPNAYGTLGADASRNVMKCGVNLSATTLGLTNAAPTTAGQSINYLISAAFSESDTQQTVLPYVNAAFPSQPFAGQSNSGTAQNTVRAQAVVFEATAGTAATTGSQTTPAPPAGYVPLFVVTVTNGETAVVGGNISQSPAAPFSPFNLQNLTPGFSRSQSFTSSTSWTVPNGVTKIKATVVGGGGAGGSAAITTSSEISGGAGGNGAGEAIGIFSVTPGEVLGIIVGAAGQPGVTVNSGVGTGGSSAVQYPIGTNLLLSEGALGGTPGAAQTVPFVTPCTASANSASGGTLINAQERPGTMSLGVGSGNGNVFSGTGGPSLFGGGGHQVGLGNAGISAEVYGAGGGGACAGNSSASVLNGGSGGGGIVIIEY